MILPLPTFCYDVEVLHVSSCSFLVLNIWCRQFGWARLCLHCFGFFFWPRCTEKLAHLCPSGVIVRINNQRGLVDDERPCFKLCSCFSVPRVLKICVLVRQRLCPFRADV